MYRVPDPKRLKRAPVACSRCRRRKVRCDVTVKGTSCTNCRLDGVVCVVKTRKNYRSRRRSVSSSSLLENTSPGNGTEGANLQQQQGEQQTTAGTISDVGSPEPSIRELFSQLTQTNEPYTSLHFCKELNLDVIQPDDAEFLVRKGCFYLPPKSMLDEFMRLYFQHVHPLLPIFDEASFWEQYSVGFDHTYAPGWSLFLLQSMLFAASAHASPYITRELGFSSPLDARNAFYHRAKLLYDQCMESDTIAKLQGALLLTYQSTRHDNQTGRTWLASAIQHAIAVGAHLYGDLPEDGNSQKALKRRIWWCLIVRDRFMALALRRPLQILPHVFDPRTIDLQKECYQGDSSHSEIYDAKLKGLLVEIFDVQCRLAIVLTDLIMLVYSPRGVYSCGRMTSSGVTGLIEEIQAIETEQAAWVVTASEALQPLSGLKILCESVAVTAQMTYVYHHSAQIALSQYKAYISKMYPSNCEGIPTMQMETIRREICEAISSLNQHIRQLVVRRATHAIPINTIFYIALPIFCLILDVQLATSTERLEEARQLSIYSLETLKRCGQPASEMDHVLCFIVHVLKRARNFIGQLSSALMHGQQPSVTVPSEDPTTGDEMSSIPALARIAKYLDEPIARCDDRRMPKSWDDLLLYYPRLYLHLSLFLDVAISRNIYPKRHDLPPFIRDLERGPSLLQEVSDFDDSGSQKSLASDVVLNPKAPKTCRLEGIMIASEDDDQGASLIHGLTPSDFTEAQMATVPGALFDGYFDLGECDFEKLALLTE